MAAGEPRLRRRQCASMQCFYRLCDEDPGFRARNARLEDVTSRRIATGRMVERRVRVIPVVVHVVWNKTSENISMAQLRSQISVLNRDFRARNRDRSKVPDVWKPIVGDSKVEFELAKKDPAGKPTNGVVRVETDQTLFDSNDSVKFRGSGGSNAWPAKQVPELVGLHVTWRPPRLRSVPRRAQADRWSCNPQHGFRHYGNRRRTIR